MNKMLGWVALRFTSLNLQVADDACTNNAQVSDVSAANRETGTKKP
jgi:hypothetical protein